MIACNEGIHCSGELSVLIYETQAPCTMIPLAIYISTIKLFLPITLFSATFCLWKKRDYLYDITVRIILGLVSKKRIFCARLGPSVLSTPGAIMCLIVTGLSQYGGSITVPLFSSCLSCLLPVHAVARTGFFYSLLSLGSTRSNTVIDKYKALNKHIC